MADRPVLRVQRLDPAVELPSYAHAGDAGLDLRSVEEFVLEPGHRRAVRTGMVVAVPEGWVGLVHPRSGLALRNGITLINAPGTIDSGYRGEVQVPLVNLGQEPFAVGVGDRIAQLLLQEVGQADIVEVTDFEESTERGTGGFGSSGI